MIWLNPYKFIVVNATFIRGIRRIGNNNIIDDGTVVIKDDNNVLVGVTAKVTIN